MTTRSKLCGFPPLFKHYLARSHYLFYLKSFDYQLDKFEVDLEELKKPAIQRIFRTWMEDWEKANIDNCDVVMEVRFLEKYKSLVFLDPDTKCYFTVAPKNLEFHRGKDKGWHVIGEPNDEDVELEVFPTVIANELIVLTPQVDGVEIIYSDDSSDENSSDPEC